MAGPQHHTPEYRRAYRAIKDAQRAGQWLTCMEPVCVMPTRDIAPWMPAHVCHDPTGTVILGPGHRRCNITEVNERRAREDGQRFTSSPQNLCVDCGQECTGLRCRECHLRSVRSRRKLSRFGEQLGMRLKVCEVCGSTFVGTRKVVCSDACAVERNRISNRELYRSRNGIPLDAPLSSRGRPRLEL